MTDDLGLRESPYLTLPYLRGGLTPSAETSSVGPVRNPEVPEGCHNLLEALRESF